jgi:hypothetical protein
VRRLQAGESLDVTVFDLDEWDEPGTTPSSSSSSPSSAAVDDEAEHDRRSIDHATESDMGARL